MRTAYIAFGSNLGDRRKNVDAALAELSSISETSLQISSLWETEPVDMVGAGPFLNGAVRIDTNLEPHVLLTRLQEIEEALGRPRDHGSNMPRHIDLDIICVGDLITDSPDLTLPHPRVRERRFVLAPLAEIAPDLLLPGQTNTVVELLEKAPPQRIRRLDQAGVHRTRDV